MTSILVIAAHPDDEILGCGGTIAKHARQGDQVYVLILAEGLTSRISNKFVDDPEVSKAVGNLMECSKRACSAVGAISADFIGLPDNRMDSIPLLEIIKPIEAKIKEVTGLQRSVPQVREFLKKTNLTVAK